ncbi:transcription factor E4F1 [Aplysia californica]|uniref:Transcription factor E4F1 n=1 Tax=Aplysia californica TaxID=6500 RepID=A0ABM0JDC3_APLCA|nr:transcription factor E4F1 [Aplysia californica]
MSKYQYSKLVMEKYLRRSFYDAVLELYETAQGTRIISVSLEGNLSLVVNKDENFIIKLNEVAQRADDREEHHQKFKEEENSSGVKLEEELPYQDRYVVKKEEEFFQSASSHQSSSSLDTEAMMNFENATQKEPDKFASQTEDIGTVAKTDNFLDMQKNKYIEGVDDKAVEYKESDSYDKSSEGESDSEEEDIEAPMMYQSQSGMLGDMSQNVTHGKVDSENTASEEICFLPVGQVDEFKRKAELNEMNDQEESDAAGKKSPRKRRKTSSLEGDEEGIKNGDKEKNTASGTSSSDDGNNGGLQLLPHTATGPIIIEEEENVSGTMAESQVAQLAMFQMREPNMGMFRQQDLEELARQQQQWTMVAYQRSIMEKSYLQHQMQQYQRDTERLRWEYAAQQQRELAQTSREYSSDEAEKLYRQAAQSQNAAAEAALLATTALEQAKKSAREGGGEELGTSSEKLSSQYVRLLGEEHGASATLEADYEEGELRPESHTCVLCGGKFMSMDLLVRHMEKHRIAFERSCSVCQSGTLTGNMLLLHMEASHGPETSFPLPSAPTATASSTSAAPAISAAPSTPSVPGTIADFSQSFPGALQANYASHVVPDGASGMKLPQLPQSPKHGDDKVIIEAHEGVSNLGVKSESEESYDYSGASTSRVGEAEVDPESLQMSQDNFLGLPSQFYPLIGCQVCGEKFALSEALDRHVESQHKDTICTYACKPCCLSFHSHMEYSKHMTRHETSSTNLKCSHCLKSFKSVKQLRLHYVAAHACCHFCEYCRAGFPDAMSLQLHEQLHTLDPEKLTFRCDICSKAFYTQSQCSAHKRTHKDEKAHACDLCGSAFFKRGDLTKHVRTVHSPSRLFSCKFCGKKGTRMDNMRSHVRSHHKNMTRDQIINMIEVIE